MRMLAERHQKAMAARDIEALKTIYSDDALIWHNTDGIALNLSDHLSSYLNNTASIVEIIYSDVSVNAFEGGYVQQHRITAPMVDGRSLEISACLVARVENNRIARLDEYLDSGAFDRVGIHTEH